MDIRWCDSGKEADCQSAADCESALHGSPTTHGVQDAATFAREKLGFEADRRQESFLRSRAKSGDFVLYATVGEIYDCRH